MKTPFTSFVSGLAMSLLLVTPVLAETSVDVNDRAHILSCREQSLREYRGSLQGALNKMRTALRSQWQRQVDFRVRAATASRRASVTSALRTAGTRLEASMTQFINAQTNGITSDTNSVVDIFARQNEDQEGTSLEQWTVRALSFQTLDTGLARAETSLRTYASVRDRTIITRVWNDTRRQVENAFSQVREEARDLFIQDMTSCVYGETAVDTEMEDNALSDVNNEVPNNNTTVTPVFAVTSVKVDSVHDILSSCSQRVTFRGQVQATRSGQVRGYFLYSDGQRSDDMTADTNANGFVMVQHNRTLTATNNASLRVGARFVVTSPTQTQSPEFPVTVTCDTGVVNLPQSQLRAEATVAVQGPSTIRTCGVYPFSFQGTISSNAAGTVQYYWLRSDGNRTPTTSISFGRAESKTVSYDWSLTATSDPANRWVQLIVVSPNTFSSQQAGFTLSQAASCTDQTSTNNTTQPAARAEAMVSLDGPSTVTTCGTYPFTFSGTISSNTAGLVSYYWMRNDGQRSPTQTITFSGPGTRNVSYEWPLSGNWSGSVRLVISAPNQLESAPASFILLQAPTCAGGQTSNNNEPMAQAEATLNLQGPSMITTCTQYPFSFQGTITLNRAGTVTYYWLHEDGTRSENMTLTFPAAGTQSVNHSWTAQTAATPYTGSVRLMVLSPNVTNAQAAFTLSRAASCAGSQGSSVTEPANNTNNEPLSPAVTSVTAALESQANVAVCGPGTFNFKGTISVNRSTEVRYQWERSNGLTSPVQTLMFEGAGSRTVADTWVTEARNINSFSRLHVLSPNDMMSNNANFTLTQSCN